MSVQKRLFELVGSIVKEKKNYKEENERFRIALFQYPKYTELKNEKDNIQREIIKIRQAVILEENIDLEVLKNGLKNDLELLSDVAGAMIMKGEKPDEVEIEGEMYVPVVQVKYVQASKIK